MVIFVYIAPVIQFISFLFRWQTVLVFHSLDNPLHRCFTPFIFVFFFIFFSHFQHFHRFCRLRFHKKLLMCRIFTELSDAFCPYKMECRTKTSRSPFSISLVAKKLVYAYACLLFTHSGRFSAFATLFLDFLNQQQQQKQQH